MLRRTVLTGAGSAALIGLAGARAARADVMDELKKRGTLVVGMEAAYVPYEFFKDGKIIGYDPDIIDHFIPKLGVKVQLVDTAWNGIIPALYAKKFDIIVSAMTITKERAEKVSTLNREMEGKDKTKTYEKNGVFRRWVGDHWEEH